MLLIKNGLIFDAIHPEPFRADILVKDGKIAKIGQNLEAAEAEVVDASQLQVYPGFVEAHCHIGLDGYGIGYEGSDYNEMNDPVAPQLRAIDGIEPTDPTFLQAARRRDQRLHRPGSANVLGGTFVAMKTMAASGWTTASSRPPWP